MPRTGIRSGRRCGTPCRSTASVASTARSMLRTPGRSMICTPESGSTGKKTSRRPLCGTQNDFRGADDKFSGQPICASYGRKKGGQRKTAARPFGIKRKSEVPIPRINPNRTNAREPGEDDRRARGLNSREHGPGHGKDQCFTLPRASGLCLYLKTSAKTTPTTRA